MKKELFAIAKAVCSALAVFIEKAGSRKFILMIIATHAFYFGILPAELWFGLAMAWQGVQGGADMLAAYNHKPRKPRPKPSNADIDVGAVAL